MPINDYPRKGHPIAPRALARFLKQKILFSDLAFADLDQSAWMKFQPLECAELAKQVVELVDRQWDQVMLATDEKQFWPKGVPILFDQIDLETRTLGLVIPFVSGRTVDEVRNLKLGDLIRSPGFGAATLVDWLTTMEYQQISCKTRSAKGGGVRSQSEGLGIQSAIIDALKKGFRPHKCFQHIQFPIPPKGYSLNDLGLDGRTFRCLDAAGYGENVSLIGSLTLAAAFELPNFGNKCAIDLFLSIERAKAKKVDPALSQRCDPYAIVLDQLTLNPSGLIPDWVRSLKLPKLPPSVRFEDLQLTGNRALAFRKFCTHNRLEGMSDISIGEVMKLPLAGKTFVCKLLKQILNLREEQNFIDVESASLAEPCKLIIKQILLKEGIDNVDLSDPRVGTALTSVFPSLERFSDLRGFQQHPLLFARLESLEYLLKHLDSLEQKPLESEFLEIFSEGRDRKKNELILSARYGLFGKASKSLEQIAEDQGVRRQRIQQICQVTTRYLNVPHFRPYAPSIDRAVRLIEDALPMRRSKIEESLVDSKLVHPKGTLSSIKSIAVLLGRAIDAEPFDEKEDSYHLSARHREFIERAKKDAISTTAKQSPINVVSLASKFGSEFGKPIPYDLLEDVLQSIKSLYWFKCKSGWYGLRSPQVQMLKLGIKKTLRFCQRIEITRLRKALLRNSENRQQIPKLEVLTEVCRSIPTARITNGVLSISTKEDLAFLFQGAEMQVVKFLMSNNAIAEIAELKSHAEKCHIHKGTLWCVLMRSPAIERLGRGKYGLIK